MDWTKNLIVGFDTETTGLDPLKDRVIQYGVVAYDPVAEKVEWSCQGLCSNDGVPIHPGAARAHGITEDRLVGLDTFDQQFRVIAGMLKERETWTALAYNAPFDLAFFGAAAKRIGLPKPLFDPQRVLDPLLIARRSQPYGNKLFEVCERLEVSLTNAHDAVADTEAAIRCMIAFHRRGQVSADLDEALKAQERSRVAWDARTRHHYWDTYNAMCRGM